jgi:hypothetical protein
MRFRKSFRAAGNIANLLILVVVFFLIFPHGMSAQASEDVRSTAWKDGRFHVDVAGVVRRSDIVLAGRMWKPDGRCLWEMDGSELPCGQRMG